MNLALQTRRAVITLSLMALAMVCVVAKTATRADALSAQTPACVETVAMQASVQLMAIKVVAKTKTHSETRIIHI